MTKCTILNTCNRYQQHSSVQIWNENGNNSVLYQVKWLFSWWISCYSHSTSAFHSLFTHHPSLFTQHMPNINVISFSRLRVNMMCILIVHSWIIYEGANGDFSVFFQQQFCNKSTYKISTTWRNILYQFGSFRVYWDTTWWENVMLHNPVYQNECLTFYYDYYWQITWLFS